MTTSVPPLAPPAERSGVALDDLGVLAVRGADAQQLAHQVRVGFIPAQRPRRLPSAGAQQGLAQALVPVPAVGPSGAWSTLRAARSKPASQS